MACCGEGAAAVFFLSKEAAAVVLLSWRDGPSEASRENKFFPIHLYTASSGLPPLFDEGRIKCMLQKIYDYNVMRVKGGRMGAVNGMHPNGKVDETCMQSREIWTGVTYSLAAIMLLHGMEHQAFTTAEGIYIAGWSEEGYGYWFQTPEAWTIDGHYRSLIYMRPLSIWAMIPDSCFQLFSNRQQKNQNAPWPNASTRSFFV